MKTLNNFKKDKTVKVLSKKQKHNIQGGSNSIVIEDIILHKPEGDNDAFDGIIIEDVILGNSESTNIIIEDVVIM